MVQRHGKGWRKRAGRLDCRAGKRAAVAFFGTGIAPGKNAGIAGGFLIQPEGIPCQPCHRIEPVEAQEGERRQIGI